MRSIFVATCLLVGWTTAQAQVSTPNQPNPAQKAQPFSPNKPPVKHVPNQPRPTTSLPQANLPMQPVATGGSSLVGGADNCSVSDVIVGTGTFAFDNTNATTGTEGQTELICDQVGAGTAIINDVWFRWTAPSSGLAVIETCNITGIDTKIAVYTGNGCPTSAAIACNDDNCSVGFQSKLEFAATAGQQYTIQLGLYPGQFPPATPGAGVFSLNIFTPPTNDECTGSILLQGMGPHAFDNTAASTGTTGQNEALCNFFGSTAINKDVWFRWRSPFTGAVQLDTCGNTIDTKIAVYQGGLCPSAPALACNDDACGLQTRVQWNVNQGAFYMIQLGLYPFTQAGGGGTFVLTQVVPPANDECTAPTVISGPGTFNFDNTFASTSTQGQAEAICSFFGSTAIVNDVWYRWTSTFSGNAAISTCGQIIDTKIAVYLGGNCPTSAAIACNDDACGLQTRVLIPVTAGQQYMIQLGLYPFTTSGGAGTFDIAQVVVPGNDNCATPSAISGLGPHNYDNTFASTGTEGQAEANCLFFGSTTIDSDLWFTWTAPSTSQFALSTCGGSIDSKIAVYQGSGCPTTSALACNDDACGLQTTVCFNATSGQVYTFQVGTFPGASGGADAFTLAPQTPPTQPCANLDDGTTENSIGLTAGGAVGWMNPFGIIGQNTTVTAVSTSYGTPLFPGGTPPAGTPVIFAVWEDPNDDGDINDGILVAQVSSTMSAAAIDTDQFQTVNISANVSGIFFAGAVVTHAAGQFPSPLDQSSGASACGNSGGWVVGETGGTLNLTNLAANSVPPQSIASAGFPGQWLVRVNCGPNAAGTPYCFGDGTGTPCPCGNSGAAGHGCANSVNPAGGLLAATGNPSVSNDTVVLQGSSMPNAAVLYFQGTSQVSVVFGDGLRCAAGTVIRLGTKTNSGGASQYPTGADLPVSVRGAIPAAGGTRNYQGWYRNAASFCTPFAFNLTNGYQIVWVP